MRSFLLSSSLLALGAPLFADTVVPRDLDIEAQAVHEYGPYSIAHRDLGSFQAAARLHGVDPALVLGASEILSGVAPSRRGSPRAEAQGWFMFAESTWLELLDAYGHLIGIEAAVIEEDGGDLEIPDADQRREKLDLRHDAFTAAVMAVALWQEHRESLGGVLEDENAIIVSHLLGPANTARLASAIEDDPSQSSIDVFGEGFTSNAFIFHTDDGPRNVAETWDNLVANLATARQRYRGVERDFIEMETDIQDSARSDGD